MGFLRNDPANRYFSSFEDRPASIIGGCYESLSTFQKAALTTNGTLTLLIEAFFCEPILAKPIECHFVCEADLNQSLRLHPEERSLIRQVHLRGEKTDRLYVAAHSVLAIDRLPVDFQMTLLHEKAGIGHAIQKMRLETFRDLQWWGNCDYQIDGVIKKYPSRCYKIFYDNREIASIFEIFLF